MKKAHIVLTKDELILLIWLIDDWRDMKSDTSQAVVYPNNSITSTQLITFLYNILDKLD